MKKLLLTLSVAMSLGSAFAQDANIPCKVQKSEVFKDEYKSSTIVSVAEDKNGGVVIVRSFQGGVFSSGAHGYYFEHYDADMKLVKEFEYELKRGLVLGSVVHEETVNIVEFNYDKEEKAYVCSVSTANINDFKFNIRELFRLERDEVRTGGLFNTGKIDSDYFATMLVDQDKTAFAISIDIDDKDTNKEMRKIYVYNNKLNLEIEHTFKRDIKDRKFKFENIDVAEGGKVAYLLGRATTAESKKKKDGGQYQYELTRITSTDSKTQVFDTDEHFAKSLKTVFKKDRIACVGFYSDRNDKRFKGLCYFDMDPVTLEMKTSKFNPFTEQFMIDKYGKDKDKELKFISFRDVFLTKNNDIVFNAEEYYVTANRSMGMNGSMGQTYYTYHYDDIVSAKIGNDGSLLWARNINKRQATDGDESYISYTSMVKDDNTYFFINTGEKVKKLRNDRIQFGQKSARRSNLNVIKINGEGEFEFKELLDDEENEVPFMVANGATIKQGESIYFLGRRGKKKQLLKLSI